MKTFKNIYSPSHEITPMTMAVIAQQDKYGNTRSLVLEEDAEYTVAYSPSKVIDLGCKLFGSSLKGRQDGTRVLSGLTHKVPISIDPSSGMYYFPTRSPVNRKCTWLAHTHISMINEGSNNSTEITFKNGKKINVNVSYGSMINQVQRTAQFRYILDNRIKHLHGYGNDWVADPFE